VAKGGEKGYFCILNPIKTQFFTNKRVYISINYQ